MLTENLLQLLSFRPLEFTISGPLSPISIRDQMIRAQCFVDLAIKAEVIGADRPLLVVGAGAAGATAAMWAARKGVRTLLVDQKKHAFTRQKDCFSRAIHPYQYDWPRKVWRQTAFPPADGRKMPLPWKAAPAAMIADIWQFELDTLAESNPSLLHCAYTAVWETTTYLRPNSGIIGEPWDERTYQTLTSGDPPDGFYGWLESTFSDPNNKQSIDLSSDPALPPRFGAALYAVGFGTEKTRAARYKGPEFWDPDLLQDRTIGWPDDGSIRRVLISGSGDGALQDLLRVTTGLATATAIYDFIFEQTDPRLVEDLLNEILQQEEAVERMLPRNHKEEDHTAYQGLDTLHKSSIATLLERDRTSSILSRIDELLNHSRLLDILLVHPCGHLTAKYALNRFLAHLIIGVASCDSARHKIKVRSHSGLCSVNPGPDHNACSSEDSAVCLNKLHTVELYEYFDCSTDPSASEPYPDLFHAVIIRHGVEPPEPFKSWRAPLFFRHLPPGYSQC